jgi:hypothetical protein
MTSTTPNPRHPYPADGGPDRADAAPADPTPQPTSQSTPQPTPCSTVNPARARELHQLRERLAQCRRRREQAEHDARMEHMLQREIVAVRRERDAGTSATLRRDRAVFERLLADVDDLVVLAARISVRLSVYGLSADHPHVHSGVSAGNAGLDAIAALAAALDPPTTTPPVSTADPTCGRRAAGTAAGGTAAGSAA